MANLQNIRRRIRSVKNIQKITNAMDMIARSRFNAARDALLMNLPYVDKTRDIVRNLMSQMQGQEDQSPFIMTRKEMIEREQLGNGKFLFLVIASDKGLAGAYASNVFKEAHDTIEYDGSEDANKEAKEDRRTNACSAKSCSSYRRSASFANCRRRFHFNCKFVCCA